MNSRAKTIERHFLDGRFKTGDSRPSDLFIAYRFLEKAQKITPNGPLFFCFVFLVLLESLVFSYIRGKNGWDL